MHRRHFLNTAIRAIGAATIAALVAIPSTAFAAVTGKPRTVRCLAKWGAQDPGSFVDVPLTAGTVRPIALSQFIAETGETYTLTEVQ